MYFECSLTKVFFLGRTSNSQHGQIVTEINLRHSKWNGKDITGLNMLINCSLLAVQGRGKIRLHRLFQFWFLILMFAPFCLLPGLTQWLRVSTATSPDISFIFPLLSSATPGMKEYFLSTITVQLPTKPLVFLCEVWVFSDQYKCKPHKKMWPCFRVSVVFRFCIYVLRYRLLVKRVLTNLLFKTYKCD